MNKDIRMLMVCIFFFYNLNLYAETYTELKEIIDANCVKCHNGDGIADFLPLESFDQIKPVAKKLNAALSSGKMPKDNTDFKDTPDGKRLLNWLTSGEDLFGQIPASQKETYLNLKPIVDANCAKCHNGDGIADFLPLESFDQIKPVAKKLNAALSSGKMPKDNTGFKDTPDGKRLLNWLTSGEDLYGPPTNQCPPAPAEHILMKDPRDLTYAMIEPIIKLNCTGCHNPNGQAARYPFQTFDQVADKANTMIKQLSKQKMPRGNPEFRFTADGRALMGWLEFGKDLVGQ